MQNLHEIFLRLLPVHLRTGACFMYTVRPPDMKTGKVVFTQFSQEHDSFHFQNKLLKCKRYCSFVSQRELHRS